MLSAIALTDQGTANTLSMLTTVAPRPQDAAGLGRVCRGSLAAVRAVVSVIGTPSARLQEIEASLGELDQVVAHELQESGTQELALPMMTRTGCVFHAMADTVPCRWRAAFHRHRVEYAGLHDQWRLCTCSA
ncbi:MAG: hypothetical protein Q7K57_13735 [Burkholderiaceae bacterium]|nr:hypothetical protein [Burkholderiaceae bacterium]